MLYLLLTALWIYVICMSVSLGHYSLAIGLVFLTCLIAYRYSRR